MLGDEMSVRRGRVARAEGRGEARPGGTKKLGVNETFAVLISGTRNGRRPSAGFGCVSEMSLAPPQSRGKEDEARGHGASVPSPLVPAPGAHG